jgi:hypothetical protein
VYPTSDLIRSYLRAVHRRRPLLPIRLPGTLLARSEPVRTSLPERTVGTKRWEEFLA